MKKLTQSLMMISLFFAANSFAGGWDKDKGEDKMKLEGELVCTGCSLKKLSGANAQCSLYSLHDLGFKLADGSIMTIVNNQKGHDIIRAHKLLEKKKATIEGWLYLNAHQIEIDSIKVEGVSADQIAMAAWKEDQKIAKALLNRKVGEAPIHDHGHH